METDARLKSKERCESTRWPTPAARGLPQRTISRSVGTPRKQFPRHAEIVQRSPGVLPGHKIRGTCLARFTTCLLAVDSFFFFFFLCAFDRAILWIASRRIRDLTDHRWGLYCLPELLSLVACEDHFLPIVAWIRFLCYVILCNFYWEFNVNLSIYIYRYSELYELHFELFCIRYLLYPRALNH